MYNNALRFQDYDDQQQILNMIQVSSLMCGFNEYQIIYLWKQECHDNSLMMSKYIMHLSSYAFFFLFLMPCHIYIHVFGQYIMSTDTYVLCCTCIDWFLLIIL